MAEDATWPGGTLNGIHTFSLDVHISSQDNPEVVTLKNAVHVAISQGDPPAANMDILVSGGGGNSDVRNYAAVPLIEGEMDLYPDDPASISLSSADVPGVYLNFSMVCQQPGIFEVEFSIPYNQASTPANDERVFSYTVNLYCPISSSLWLVDAQTGQLTSAGNFIFQDGQYIQQP